MSSQATVDAAVVAVPTSVHAEMGCALLERGIDVLVEKPIAADRRVRRRLVDTAARHGRILQVGPSGALQPAVVGAEEDRYHAAVFRNSSPQPVQPAQPGRGRGAGSHDPRSGHRARPGRRDARGDSSRRAFPCLSDKVDIANVRLAFPGGCIANLTASRVSTERVRKAAPVSAAPVHFARLPEAGSGRVHGVGAKADRVSAAAGHERRAAAPGGGVVPGSPCATAPGRWCRARKGYARWMWPSPFLLKLRCIRS